MLENQVCSLESAKRLKELGAKQESLWYWTYVEYDTYGRKHWELLFGEYYHAICKEGKIVKTLRTNRGGIQKPYKEEDSYSAFTVAELGEMLKKFWENRERYLIHILWGKWWFEKYHFHYSNDDPKKRKKDECHWDEADTEANARAKLLEHNLIQKEAICQPEK